MAINDSTLYTDTYTAVRTVLVDAGLTNVFAMYNDTKSTSPQVIIGPIEKSEAARYKFGSNEGRKLVNITITAYAKNTLTVDQLKEQIEAAMKANEFDDLMLTGITVSDAFINPNEAKYHFSSITFSYDRES